MDRPKFEEKYGFVPAFDQKRKKRVSLAPHLAKDPRYLEKMGFELIEKPEDIVVKFTPQVEEKLPEWTNEPEMVTEITETITEMPEKPKRGRPKKQ